MKKVKKKTVKGFAWLVFLKLMHLTYKKRAPTFPGSHKVLEFLCFFNQCLRNNFCCTC